MFFFSLFICESEQVVCHLEQCVAGSFLDDDDFDVFGSLAVS